MSKRENQAQPAKGKVQVGDWAQDFTLPDQSGAWVCLADFLGKTAIVLYFYPKDNTSVCTAEACAFRDRYEVFQAAGARSSALVQTPWSPTGILLRNTSSPFFC